MDELILYVSVNGVQFLPHRGIALREYDIAVLDDDEDDRQILHDAFAETGERMRVLLFETTSSLLTYLDTVATTSALLPKLIIVDYHIAVENCPDILHKIKSKTAFQHIPVVVYSSSSNKTFRDDCFKAGCEACIEKAFTYKEVLRFVQHTCYEIINRNNRQ